MINCPLIWNPGVNDFDFFCIYIVERKWFQVIKEKYFSCQGEQDSEDFGLNIFAVSYVTLFLLSNGKKSMECTPGQI